MRKLVITSIFAIVIISLLNITLPVTSRQRANSQQEYVSQSSVSNTEDILISKYQNINYIDNETYSKIKEAYNKLNFNIFFNLGNVEEYGLYKKQFDRLLRNQVMFTEKQTGKEFYLNEYGFFSIDVDLGIYELNNYTYYFFDMDGDDSPELCISDKASFTYIIKYNKESDQFTLWQRYETPYIFLLGTKSLGYSGNGRDAFFMLNESGENDYFLWFKIEGYRDSESKKDNYCFMVTLPQYVNQYSQDELTKHMRNQASFDENQELYYFRVTEEQYNELTKDYFKSVEIAREAIKDVTFTYKELFGA
ncbi:MAG: hypothetical protein LBT06_17165 [Hungatella sp.]|jgi:hypothetical protein|nr:hypothetical protein [Hungatella sp.]